MIAQRTKPIDVVNTDFGKIHGHTKIILTSVRNGKQKVIEHDNTFQSAIIAKQLRTMGAANNNPWRNTTWAGIPLWRNLVGGIFLFEDAIDNSNGDVEYMPAGNKMVANGCAGVSNAATPTELGSFNAIESSTSGNSSISLVYDWGTSQGNGTISCVCLTSETGGYIGYGNASGDHAQALRNISINQSTDSVGLYWFYGDKRFLVTAINTENKTVTIKKGQTNKITKTSVFQDGTETATDYTYTGTAFGDSATMYIYTKQLNAEEIAIIGSTVSYGGRSISNGSTGNIIVFNMRTETLRLQPIVNTTGESIDILTTSSTMTINLTSDKNGNYYVAQNGYVGMNLYKFGSNGVFAGVVSNKANASGGIGRLTDEFLHIVPNENGANEPFWIFDGTTARVTNGTICNGNAIRREYCDTLDAMIAMTASNGDHTIYKNPLYLATINNLDAPITKDSTQTMKVIYTLTEA